MDNKRKLVTAKKDKFYKFRKRKAKAKAVIKSTAGKITKKLKKKK